LKKEEHNIKTSNNRRRRMGRYPCRDFCRTSRAENIAICDLDESRAAAVTKNIVGLKVLLMNVSAESRMPVEVVY